MRIFGLIGYPLSHSFSAGYFKEKFKNEGITDAQYLNFPISSLNEFPLILEQYSEIKGLNVTIPYKEKIMEFLDEVDNTASKIGAVNTISINKNPVTRKIKLIGYNTDADGFIASLKDLLCPDISQALILGTGGASKAIIYSLKKIGMDVLVVSRKPSKKQISYQEINNDLLKTHKLIVNTTPLGTFPKTDEAPDIPYHLLTKNHILHDLVYNPAETSFMKKGAQYGAKVKNGYQMLLEQAELAWKIWNQK